MAIGVTGLAARNVGIVETYILITVDAGELPVIKVDDGSKGTILERIMAWVVAAGNR